MSRYFYSMLAAAVAGSFLLVSGCTVVHSTPDGETITTGAGEITIAPHTDPNLRPAPSPSDNALAMRDRKAADEAARELADLHNQLDLVHGDVARAMKDRANAIQQRDSVNAEVDGAHQTTAALKQHLEELNAGKTALEAGIAALEIRQSGQQDQLHTVENAIAERKQQIVALDKERTDNGAATATSRTVLDRITHEIKTANARLHDLQTLASEQQRGLAGQSRKDDAAMRAATPIVQPSTQSAAIAVNARPMPVTPPKPSKPSWMLRWCLFAGLAVGGLIAIGFILRVTRVHDQTIHFDCIAGEESQPLTFTLDRHDGLALSGETMRCEPLELIDGAFICTNRRGRVQLFAQPGCNITCNGQPAEGVVTLTIGDRLDLGVDRHRKSYVFRGRADDTSDDLNAQEMIEASPLTA